MSQANHQDQTSIFYLISDAVGSLVNNTFNSALVQFPTAKYDVQRYPFVQHIDALAPILERAAQNQAHIIASFSQPEMNQYAQDFCQDHQLFYYGVLQPVIDVMSKDFNMAPTGKPGSKHRLDDEYYKRIEALEFAVLNDDGQHPSRFEEADIVLLGISRTSKTPLSMYLANSGYKVANLPLVPEARVPDTIYQIDRRKIIGLTNDVNVLNKFRRERMIAYGLGDQTRYANDNRIQEELDYAHKIYNELQCPIINVADRSIEETATLILMFLNLENKPM
ncbi:phosphoenolpyruvate synthase regulatory protein [Aerococcus urinaehominis]|uniref:Putative pyruvate, phosphate dikinase regulatory protein n=1 Tax=Aerococcus urinaehominis TaxID=128944 RepID=A0A0X8FJJ3_9LACT|nr:pyruvate, water dikinase regulatory protein [Aerococcus urinaehominis]AMB98518.1 phosphoenolpyruvate synthase regulatory protein [Aerococcus urinaehominis]SDL79784.1 hypothetical protein SAMN04487985_10193 [Aerococcus urinaehominis]